MVESLVIGANGLIGREARRALLRTKGGCAGTYFGRPEEGLVKLDRTCRDEVERMLGETAPKVVLDCANFPGGVNRCEQDREAARQFHLEATRNLSRCCKEAGAFMVYISSDYVFDGTKTEPYREEDEPKPANHYGELKHEAEEAIRQEVSSHLIVRTTNVFGWDPMTRTPNYIMNLYRTIREERTFWAPSFLWGTPTYVGDLVEGILELVDRGATGTYHVVGKSFVNRYEWAKEACRTLGLDGTYLAEVKEPDAGDAARPKQCRLSTDRFESVCKTVLHGYREGTALMKREMGGAS